MNKFLLGGAAAAICVAASAVAQPVPPSSAPQVQTVKVQRAARVHTRNEVVQHVRDLFTRLDTNRDGFITRPEADSAKQVMGGGMRERIAKRRAGRDLPTRDRGAAFDRLDANRDGMITRQEFTSARPRMEQRRVIVMRDAPGSEGMGQVRKMRAHRMGGGLHGRLFETADADRDGRVSLQEATGAALQRFDSADSNRDGQLTPDERMQRRERIRMQRRPA
jgi:hypothetical protein